MRVSIPHLLGGIGAFDVVHRDPKLTVVLSPVMDRDYVGMPQGCGDVGFTRETLSILRVGAHTCRQNLQRLLAGQPRMLHEIDLAQRPGLRSWSCWFCLGWHRTD